MSVAGYNVDPEADEPVIGVEIETSNEIQNGKACIYIDEGATQVEVHLDWYELKAHIWECNRVRIEMEWNMAAYAYASQGIAGDTQHLLPRGDAKLEKSTFSIEPTSLKFEKSLCGRAAPVWQSSEDPRGWQISPVIEEPRGDHVCKRCYAKWQKVQQGGREDEQDQTL
jgi:hypothetical protein